MGLHGLAHLIHQWHHPVPFGAKYPMLPCCPAADGGNRLIRGNSNLARGHDFHPVIHHGFDLLSSNPGPPLYGLMILGDFIQRLYEGFLRHLARNRAILPGIERSHSDCGLQLFMKQVGNSLQRQAIAVSQLADSNANRGYGFTACASTPCGWQADFDLTAMSFERVDQVIQECVSHGKPL